MSFFVAFVALLIDRFVPIPAIVGNVFSHPVVWQGQLIQWLETALNKNTMSASKRKKAGIAMLTIVVGVTLLTSIAVVSIVYTLPFAQLFEAVLAAVFLAHKSLHNAVGAVAKRLEYSVHAARLAVAHIVGRDTNNLSAPEISRAAIESLAENSSDGIIAPLFWLALFGLPGIAVYKAINTADSMVGHKNVQYVDFGWASAKLDDIVNWIPARFTAMLYVFAARFEGKEAAENAAKTAMRDAPAHVSPNAGWPEAALAGALDYSLGGPRAYGGETLNLPFMGMGKRELDAQDIWRALSLSRTMSTLALVGIGLLALIQFL